MFNFMGFPSKIDIPMKIHLGHNLDFEPFLELLFPTGEAVLGELGLVQALEGRFGHHTADAEPYHRILQYQQCLTDTSASAPCFYRKSFELDPFAASERILAWRDQLYAMGWDGVPFETRSERLRQMFEIEEKASEAVAPNIDQRIRALLKTLEYSNTGIDSIHVLTPPNSFSNSINLLLVLLGNSVPITWEKPKEMDLKGESDLVLLKAWVKSKGGAKVPFKGDGSLQLYETQNTLDLAIHLLLEQQAGLYKDGLNLVFDRAHCSILSEAARLLHSPHLPSARDLSSNPVLHWVLLFFQNTWGPFDPAKMIEYLLHPMGAFPAWGRRKTAEHISEKPGYNYEEWLALFRAEDGDVLGEDHSFWLTQNRLDPIQGAAPEFFLKTCDKISSYLLNRANADTGENSSAYHTARSFVEALRYTILSSEVQSVTKQSLDKIIFRLASRMGSRKTGDFALGSLRFLQSGFASTRAVNSLTWWPGSVFSKGRDNWAEGEKKDFQKHGLKIGELTRRQSLPWLELQHLLNQSEKQLKILRCSGFSQHPVFSVLNIVFDNPVFYTWKGFEGQEKEIAYQPLPGLQRWWQIPGLENLAPRASESYSSLNSLVFSPYQWLFRYPCALREGVSLPVLDNRTKGDLVHKLFELHFREFDHRRAWDKGRILTWLDTTFPGFLETHGALLLLEENKAKVGSFRKISAHALVNLHKLFQDLKVKRVFSEKQLRFQGQIPVNGYLDILAELESGELLVIELKWSRSSKFVGEIERGRAFQLAVYQELAGRSFPGPGITCGYYVVPDSRLVIFGRNKIFPGIPTDHNLQDLFQGLLNDSKARFEQLKQGFVEVPVNGTEEEEFPGGECKETQLVLNREFETDKYNDYSVITGWGPLS